MHTQLCPCASGHSPGWVPRLELMPWTAPTHNFFLENQKQQTPCLKFWNVWFKAFIEAQILTGITQILSPRRCQEHSVNLGRSFSVTNTKANKKQIQRVLRYALKTTLVKHFRGMWKLVFWGVSRDSLRSSSGKQTKAWTLVHVRFFYNIQKYFWARRTTIRWCITCLWKFCFQLFGGWRGFSNHVIKEHSSLSSAFSWHIFLLLYKRKVFFLLTSTARSTQNFTLTIFFLTSKELFGWSYWSLKVIK